MTFDEILSQIQDLLQREQRVSYRGLKRRFAVDDEYLEDLKEELIGARRLAVDEDGRFLVWIGNRTLESSVQRLVSEEKEQVSSGQTLDSRRRTLDLSAERRQLTVMFCDLVGSTALSTQLDPEELRQVVRTYQETCTSVVQRYEGYVAQYLGDGLLVYFGYPAAHEDDAARAVRAGLEIVTELSRLNEQASATVGARRRRAPTDSTTTPPLQVRIGIHTGLVVIDEIGSSEKREILALGETPNLAARVQGTASPDEVRISAATHHLVEGLFACEECGQPDLKGVATPLTLYHVITESNAHSRFEVVVRQGLTPLIGREPELGLLRERWERVKAGAGQVVLLSGEPGIGKSRLVQELKEQLAHDGAMRVEFRCSPYHQNSALYPIIDHLQRLLQFTREDTPAVKVDKLQHALARYRFPQADTAPLLTALLSLPHPEGYPPITVSPQKQKEKTQAALIAWLVEEAELRPVYTVWEDLHWADPSTLELLTLFLDQVPTTRLFALLTFRPEFTSLWGNRSHLSPVTLSRLESSQVKAIVENVAGDKTLPSEVLQQIVSKTDGVPLFVEELTKTVVEAVEARHAAPLQTLGIPATLQDALMARLDRLGPAKEIAQLGATIGREFSYELLHAVSPLDEERLQRGLKQLAEAELVYQRGIAPQAHYLFKHALIQDTAYQSLLKSTRQQYHQQIVHVLEERFPDTKENQPELLAHHYTEAKLVEQAIPCWQQAGQKAARRMAHAEAISHLTQGLTLLSTLPQTPVRAQQELRLQLNLSDTLQMAKGSGSTEREQALIRARELCQRVGETPELFFTLLSLLFVHLFRAEFLQARKLAEQVLPLAQSTQIPHFLMYAHWGMGETLLWMGEFGSARVHMEQGIALYETQQYRPQEHPGLINPLVPCFFNAAMALWMQGYPDQALKRIQEAQQVAKELAQPFGLAITLNFMAGLHQFRLDVEATRDAAEQLILLSTEQGFPDRIAIGTFYQGWALTRQGQEEEGLAQMHRGWTEWQAAGAKVTYTARLASLAEGYGRLGRPEEGLPLLTEALELVNTTGERYYEAELYRMKGELLLAQAGKLRD